MEKSPPRIVKPNKVQYVPRFAYGDQASVAVVCSHDDGSELGAGYVRMTDANIPWTIRYDEVVLVVEGELQIETAEKTHTIGEHESIWLPAGTELVYRAQNALVFYAIHPSNWAAS